MSARLASWLGYDPAHVRALPVGQQRALALAALGALPGLGLLGLSAGYGTWLATDLPALAVAVGVGAAAYLLNLLRVSVAGGGAAAHQPVRAATTWAPRAVPLVMLALLGAFFAQPLALWALEREQDEPIAELRQALGQMHEEAVLGTARKVLAGARERQASASARVEVLRGRIASAQRDLAALGERPDEGGAVEARVLTAALAEHRAALVPLERELEDSQRIIDEWTHAEAQARAEDVNVYRAHLERSHFLVRRVQLTLAHPARPLAASATMVVLMILPWLLSATVARAGHRAYERRRWAATRALVEHAHAQARTLEAQALSAWPSFTTLREELFEDPPYNTRPRSRLEARHG